MIILLHSSKTMRQTGTTPNEALSSPQFINQATRLNQALRSLNLPQIEKLMKVSPKLASSTSDIIAKWGSGAKSAACDSFVGDIYSGLRADSLSKADRKYAQKTLCILSGLYGLLRPLDSIEPYRLEMGYRLQVDQASNLYQFWEDKLAKSLPEKGLIINTSSVEYTKAILPYVDPTRVHTPNFLTLEASTRQPKFVTVHAKIARGAFARWLIISRVTNPADFAGFDDLNYRYDKSLSTVHEPVYVCPEFGGIGLSQRLK